MCIQVWICHVLYVPIKSILTDSFATLCLRQLAYKTRSSVYTTKVMYCRAYHAYSWHAEVQAEQRAPHWGGESDMVHPPSSNGLNQLCRVRVYRDCRESISQNAGRPRSTPFRGVIENTFVNHMATLTSFIFHSGSVSFPKHLPHAWQIDWWT